MFPKDFAHGLVNVASSKNNDLTETQKILLVKLMQFLIDKMNEGNSCINLINFISHYNNQPDSLSINIFELCELIINSGLGANYKIDATIYIPKAPIIIIQTKNSDFLLAFARYLTYELYVVDKLKTLNTPSMIMEVSAQNLIDQLNSQNDRFPNQEQIFAIKTSILNKLSFITGGPGTGKTTTIVMLLVMLLRAYTNQSNPLKIDIVAPTGKAGVRVKESVTSNIVTLMNKFHLTDIEISQLNNINYSTIHRLLGYKHGSIYFKHNQNNQLEVDILIVDESSMISLPLMYKLLTAINQDTIKHIIFLGDENQLSSVEEGYVFASLSKMHKNNNKNKQPNDLFTNNFKISQLLSSNRNVGDISSLANGILNGDIDFIHKLLSSNNQIKLLDNNIKLILEQLFIEGGYLDNYIQLAEKSINNVSTDIVSELFNYFKQFVILCAVNSGNLGVDNLNVIIEATIKDRLRIIGAWYTGRPVLILENNKALDIYNGDIGICVIKDNQPIIYFDNGKEYIPEILPHYQLAYAITIHKSQGSEYNHVNIILPNTKINNNSLLSRELFYTAVTRARNTITLFANTQIINQAVENKITRVSIINHLL